MMTKEGVLFSCKRESYCGAAHIAGHRGRNLLDTDVDLLRHGEICQYRFRYAAGKMLKESAGCGKLLLDDL